ncbi:MAG TPA: ribokinase [Chloroflexota bacterium]|nr:ribokinase [Chloroflexota bacterium]
MITVVGSANMDLIARVSRLPEPGETVLGTEFRRVPGGKGANQAVAAARAGSEVRFVGRVGNDMYGTALVENLEDTGVDVRHVQSDDATPTGTALIAVDELGQNTIIVLGGANAALSPNDVDAAAPSVTESALLVLQLEIPLATVARAADVAAGAGARIVLNASPPRPLESSLLRQVDVLVVNEVEVGRLSGMGAPVDPETAARLLLDRGPKAVVVTLGSDGAVVVTRQTETSIPAVPVEVIDSTGAGDAFAGNLAHALESGDDLVKATRFACAAASLSVGHMGAQPSMPSRAQTLAALGEK